MTDAAPHGSGAPGPPRAGQDAPERRDGTGRGVGWVAVAAWGVAALAVALWRNGVWATLNLDLFARMADRFGRPADLPASADYLLASPLGPAVARALRQTDPHAYARLHLVVALVGLGAVLVATARALGATAARNLAVALAVAPVTTSTLGWLGQPDAFSLPLALALVVVRSPAATLALAVPLGLAHPEQGLVIAVTATLARMAIDDERSWRRIAGWVATVGGGVLAGRALTEVYLRVTDQRITRPRTAFVDLGLDGFWRHHTQDAGWVLWSLWGLLWVVLVGAAATVVRRDRRAWALLGIGAALALAPTFLTLDETRVHGVVTAPLVVGGAVLLARLERPGTRAGVALAAALLVAGLLVPAAFTAGTACRSHDLPTAEMVRFLVDGDDRRDADLFGWLYGPCPFVIPTD